jgi:hypothetical protein
VDCPIFDSHLNASPQVQNSLHPEVQKFEL